MSWQRGLCERPQQRSTRRCSGSLNSTPSSSYLIVPLWRKLRNRISSDPSDARGPSDRRGLEAPGQAAGKGRGRGFRMDSNPKGPRLGQGVPRQLTLGYSVGPSPVIREPGSAGLRPVSPVSRRARGQPKRASHHATSRLSELGRDRRGAPRRRRPPDQREHRRPASDRAGGRREPRGRPPSRSRAR